MTIIAGHALLYGKENCFLICMWRLDRLLGSEGSAVLHGAGSLDADHLPLVISYNTVMRWGITMNIKNTTESEIALVGFSFE